MFEKTGLILLIVIVIPLSAFGEDASSFNLADYPYEPGDRPVWHAISRLGFIEHGTFNDALSSFWDTEGHGMGDEDFLAYISERYKDGQVTAENWLETENLFDAALFYARKKNNDPDIRRECLEIALKAAAQSLDLDLMNTQVSGELWRLYDGDSDDIFRKEEGWFCDQIVDLYKRKLGATDYENALTLYNIGEVLKAKGDYELAAKAYASSHALFPKDLAPACELRDIQMKLGDWQGALATLADLEAAERELPGAELSLGQTASDAGEAYLNLGMYEEAKRSLMLALDYVHRAVAQMEEDGDDQASKKLAPYLNRCTTSLGLVALAMGDRDKAIKWFEESFVVNSQHMALEGYDLRLVKELMKDPSLRILCISYLQLALEAKMTKTEDEVKALLAQLTGDQTAANVRGAAPSGKADEGVPDRMASQKTDPQRTQAEQAAPQNSQKKQDNRWAVAAVIIAAVLAAIYANRRKKAKGAKT